MSSRKRLFGMPWGFLEGFSGGYLSVPSDSFVLSSSVNREFKVPDEQDLLPGGGTNAL